MDATIRQRSVCVGDVRVHYRWRDGEGPAVVLLPGGVIDSTALTWGYVFEALPAPFPIIVPDLPGYGRSDTPDVSYSTEYFITFLQRLLDALALERVHLFGSSMTGAVVLGLGIRHPERVVSLGLSGAYGWQPRVPLHEAAYALTRLPFGWAALLRWLLQLHPQVVRAALPVSVHCEEHINRELVRDAYNGASHPGALRAFMRWLRTELLPRRVRTDFTPELHRLTMPVLILHGAHDWVMPVRYARRAAAQIPHARLHVFEEAGHLVPREHPAAVNRIIHSFLCSVTS
jgi:pimeloyl-ACP methyl ester carboxylesterase